MVFISPDHKAFLLWGVFLGEGGWLTSHEFLDKVVFHPSLRILTPPMETPDPPSDTPGASKKVFLTPHDIPRILRAGIIPDNQGFQVVI